MGGLGGIIHHVFSFSSHPRSLYLFTNFLPLTVLTPRDADKTALKRESAQQLVCVHVCESVRVLCETTPTGESERLRIISSSLMPGQPFFWHWSVWQALSFFLPSRRVSFMEFRSVFLHKCFFFFFFAWSCSILNCLRWGERWQTTVRFRVYSFPLPLTSLLTQRAGR